MIILTILLVACGKAKKGSSVEFITEAVAQDSIFRKLIVLTDNRVPEATRHDSLAFLVLPVQASCPACRKKTIDSIIKNESRLLPNHFVVISAIGGKKIIGSYFKEEHAGLPESDNVILDSANSAYKYNLYTDKPTFYYTHNQKAYKRVAAIPITVKEDLREFFSGYRNVNK
ncbi:hypothetical protein SAMN05660816_03648 [Niastella yeongjuensis]|nr:hypothetical protein SAMN05660816_03648 [Niastella yeongjuensis]